MHEKMQQGEGHSRTKETTKTTTTEETVEQEERPSDGTPHETISHEDGTTEHIEIEIQKESR